MYERAMGRSAGRERRPLRKPVRAVALLAAVAGLWLASQTRALAAVWYTDPNTEYVVIMEDDADLLTGEEEAELAEKMESITGWGNAAFKTIGENSTSTERYIEEYYREIFGRDSGTVFLIDMDNRNIWIKNDGRISRIITNSYSDTITDNCYRYASKGDYFDCAMEVFEEIETLLSGSRIAQPMKYVSNAFLAVILALLINYFLMRRISGNRGPKEHEMLKGMKYRYSLTDARAEYLSQTKKYDPISTDSGSDSGGSSGGGGGGGSSGSGGGHSF